MAIAPNLVPLCVWDTHTRAYTLFFFISGNQIWRIVWFLKKIIVLAFAHYAPHRALFIQSRNIPLRISSGAYFEGVICQWCFTASDVLNSEEDMPLMPLSCTRLWHTYTNSFMVAGEIGQILIHNVLLPIQRTTYFKTQK